MSAYNNIGCELGWSCRPSAWYQDPDQTMVPACYSPCDSPWSNQQASSDNCEPGAGRWEITGYSEEDGYSADHC